jgi:DUF971 family protein
MHPTNLQQINEFLAVAWDDGHESVFPLEYLRRHCPCAACKGESVGPLHFQPQKVEYAPESFQLERIDPVGGYALKPVWKDGHATGLYSFEWLRHLCPCDVCGGEKKVAG